MIPLGPPHNEALQIHNDHIVWMRVGMPHKWLRFRLRMDTADTYLFQHPNPWSRSWTPLPMHDEYGQSMVRETVIMGTTALRVNMVVGRYFGESTATVEGTQSEGVLGIGPGSPMWTVWRNFTKSRDRLYLGSVLPRASEASDIAIRVDLIDTWMRGLRDTSDISAFSMLLTAKISAQSRHEIEHNCMDALHSRDESVDLVASQEMLVDVLAVAPDEHTCAVRERYHVVFDPDSDFNIIPPVLTLHPPKRPPLFRLAQRHADQDDTSLHAVLFDMFDDMYVEVDATSRAGSGVRRMANKLGFNDSVIVIGTFGARRFELTYQLDANTGWVSLKHSGMSQRAQARESDRSVEVRRIQDISILVAGILLWALLAAEPDPLFPNHAHEDKVRFPHASRTGIQVVRPPPAQPDFSKRASPQTPTNDNIDSTESTFVVRESEGGMRLSRRRPQQTQQHAHSQPVGVSSDQQQQQQRQHEQRESTANHINKLHSIARDSAIKSGAVIQAAYTMESEWPISLDVLLYIQLLVDAVVGVFVIIAMRFYDTAWALSVFVYEDVASDAVGWASIALIVAALFALSFAGTFSAGRDARLGSLCLQGELLIGLALLSASLFEWDLALGMLLVLTVLIGIVLAVMVLHTYALLPQYHKWSRSPRVSLRGMAAILAIAWFLYASLAVIPFAIGRLWDNKAESALIGIFLILSIVFPAAMWLSINAFLYPLRVSNAAIKHILLVSQQQFASLTRTV